MIDDEPRPRADDDAPAVDPQMRSWAQHDYARTLANCRAETCEQLVDGVPPLTLRAIASPYGPALSTLGKSLLSGA